MSAVKIVLLSLMVWGLASLENTNKKQDELMPKKQEFVIMANSFQFFNDFENILGIISKEIQIIGINPKREDSASEVGTIITSANSAQSSFCGNNAKLHLGVMCRGKTLYL
jgi:hypothetical protein